MAIQRNYRQTVDPVCGMNVTPAHAAGETTYQGRRIYFCAAGCKRAFDADPERYVSRRPKGLWGRYLDRLNKATGGKPPSCCS